MLADTTSSASHPSTNLRFPPVSTRPPSRARNAFTQSNPICTYHSCQSHQSSVGSIDRPLPLLSQFSVVETRMLQVRLSFSRSLLCHAALILIRPFLVLPAPMLRFRALVLAQMTDGPPRSTSSCASAPPCRALAISSVPVIPSSLFPSTLSIFAPTSLPHPVILCRPLFSCRTSCLRVRCLLRKTPFRLFLCLSTFLSSFFTPSP
jgi:hypothetical protein